MDLQQCAICRWWTPLCGGLRMMVVWSIVHLYCLGPAQGFSLPALSSPYYLVKQSLTWVEALTYCRTQNMDLASIQSDSELLGVSAAAALNEVWIGLYLCSPGLWRWTSGNALGTYSKWNYGIPGQTSYSCARLSFGLWNDGSCDQRYYFVCYKATAPDIPATCLWPLVSTTVASIISPTNGNASNKQYTNGLTGPTNGLNQSTNGVNQQPDDIRGPTNGDSGQANTFSGRTTGLTIQKGSTDQIQSFASIGNILAAGSNSASTVVQKISTLTTTSSVSSASSDSITTSWTPLPQNVTGSIISSPATLKLTGQSIGAVSGLLHLVQTPMSWAESRWFCRSNFTDLAAVLSLQEQNNMAALLSPYTPSGGFWIGMRYNRFRSQWYWSGRQKWGAFSYWGAGEPNDPFNNSCGMISGDPTQNFTWSTQCCGQKLPFVCYGGL